MSPLRPCLLSLSYFRPTVWYCTLKDRSMMSPKRPCLSSLSYFRPMVRYCRYTDRICILYDRVYRVSATLDLQYGTVF